MKALAEKYTSVEPEVSVNEDGEEVIVYNITVVPLKDDEELKAVSTEFTTIANVAAALFTEGNVHGTYHISLRGRCEVSVGNENHVSTVAIMLIRNKLKIGSNCTFAGGIRIWGDGHAILDNSTGQVLNEPKGCITIGNHVWIGENVAITKNAGIPDDSIVGIQSVVSKKFTENHVVIAGNPAAIVKHGVSWDINAPDQCIETIKQGGKLNNNYWN